MDVESALEQAAGAIRQSNKRQAQIILAEVVQQEPRNEAAWLLLADAVERKEYAIDCLERVLKFNPNSQIAREGLARLRSIDLTPTPPQTSLTERAARASSFAQRSESSRSESISAPQSLVVRATKKCPYCAEEILAEARACRFCGRELATGQVSNLPHPATSTELQPSLLDLRIESFVKEGWQVINRTPTAAQLKKPKQWSQGCLVLFVVIPLLGGLLFPPLFGVAIIALLLAVVDYALKKDEIVYLTEEHLHQEEQRRLEEQRRREEQAKRNEQERLETKRKREEGRRLKEERRRAEQATNGSKQIMGLTQQQLWMISIWGGAIIGTVVVIAIAIAVILAQQSRVIAIIPVAETFTPEPTNTPRPTLIPQTRTPAEERVARQIDNRDFSSRPTVVMQCGGLYEVHLLDSWDYVSDVCRGEPFVNTYPLGEVTGSKYWDGTRCFEVWNNRIQLYLLFCQYDLGKPFQLWNWYDK